MKLLGLMLAGLLAALVTNAGAECTSSGAGLTVSASGLLGLEANVQEIAYPPGGSTSLVDTAALPIPLPLPISVRVLSAKAGKCNGSADVAHVAIELPGGLLSITADVGSASASVGGRQCSAAADVVNLQITLAGVPVPLPDLIPPNLVVPLGPLGSLVVDEQSCSRHAATANVLHLSLLVGLPPLGESIDIAVAHADASN